MKTKDRLAQAMRDAGLPPAVISAAQAGVYDDFESLLDFPAMALIRDLESIDTPAARKLRQRVMQGDFDSTAEEAEAWAASADGQRVLRAGLLGKFDP